MGLGGVDSFRTNLVLSCPHVGNPQALKPLYFYLIPDVSLFFSFVGSPHAHHPQGDHRRGDLDHDAAREFGELHF